jgi:hypothetical protein
MRRNRDFGLLQDNILTFVIASVLKQKFAFALLNNVLCSYFKIWKYYERLFRVCSKSRNPKTEENLIILNLKNAALKMEDGCFSKTLVFIVTVMTCSKRT